MLGMPLKKIRRSGGPDLSATLRWRTLIAYLAILLAVYSLAIVSAVALDPTQSDPRGEIAAVLLCLIGVALAFRRPLHGKRYAAALLCVAAAPVAALLFHRHDVAQVWSLIPIMFVVMYIRTWHGPRVARLCAIAIAVTAVLALLVAPASVQPLWLLLYAICILAASEILGVMNSALLDAALRDPLTSTWNRAGVDRHAHQVLARAHKRGEQVAVFALDIDDFKTINDRNGHAAGDQVLVDLTRHWVTRLPEEAVIGRVGGDEFVAVVSGYDEGAARNLGLQLTTDHPVRTTFGLAVGRPDSDAALAELFASADDDLYRRKRERKKDSAAEPD